jgi:WD40 repeat protein
MKKIVTLIITLTFIILNLQAQDEEEPIAILKKHKGTVNSVAFSRDGKLLVTGGEDKSINIWDITTYLPLKTVEQSHISTVQALAFSIDGKYIFSSGDRVIKIWDTNGQYINTLSGFSTYIWTISPNPKGKYVLCCSYENTPRIWDYIQGGKHVNQLVGHTKSSLVARYSPNGKFIASGSLDLSINIWDTDSFKIQQTLRGQSGNIFDVQWFNDNTHIVTASLDKTIFLWNVSNQKSIRIFRGHQNAVSSLAISSDNRFLLSASYDKTVRLWDLITGSCIYSYSDFEGGVNAVVFSPNDSLFATASSDGVAKIYRFNKNLVVDYYFANEVAQEIAASPLFKPKNKDEKREEYEARKIKADELKQEIYNKYYAQYLEKYPIIDLETLLSN